MSQPMGGALPDRPGARLGAGQPSEEKQDYRGLLESLPDGWLLTGITGAIQEANRVAATLLRTEPTALLGHSLGRYAVPEAQTAFEAHLVRLRMGLAHRRGGCPRPM